MALYKLDYYYYHYKNIHVTFGIMIQQQLVLLLYQPIFQLITSVWAETTKASKQEYLKGAVKEPNMFHNYETEKITRKASDPAENLQLLYRVVWFFHPRSSCTMHLMLFSERPPTYASSMTTLGVRTKQHIIYCRIWRAGCSRLGYVDIYSVY